MHQTNAFDSCVLSKGPDAESFTTGISLQVPTQAELRHKLSSLSSTCTDSASQDTEAGEEDDEEEDENGEQGSGGGRRPPVVVTLDEEEVHPDTALLDQSDHQEGQSKDCVGSRAKVWTQMDDTQTAAKFTHNTNNTHQRECVPALPDHTLLHTIRAYKRIYTE